MNNSGNMSFLPLLFQSLFTLFQTPEAARFFTSFQHVQQIQKRLLLRSLRHHQDTAFGRQHGFSRITTIDAYRRHVPIRTYQGFLPYIERIRQGEPYVLTAEPVRYFLPTGGTTGTKLIPYTTALKQEFQRALAPWLVDVARHFPAILQGKTYWSVTPPGHRLKQLRAQQIPIGFEEDSAYFGWKGRLLGNIFVVPSWITQLHSIDNFRFLTLYFLLREQNLRWLSIWSPTFFLVLLEELERQVENLLASLHNGYPELPEAEALPVELPRSPMRDRRRMLERILVLPEEERYARIWPCLAFVSLWQDAYARYPAKQLARLFPNTYFQGKGLLATEGVMTIPLHKARGCVPAYTSHLLEFLSNDQEARCVWELEEGNTYTVLLTTGGGLYRYHTGDLVTVTGFYRNVPLLRFVGRTGRTSDLAGEKLDEQFVNRALDDVFQGMNIVCTFLLLAPEVWGQTRGYVVFIESSQDEAALLTYAKRLDDALRQNIHYDFAVKMNQLVPVRVFRISHGGRKAYVERCLDEGQQMGDIKPLRFDTRTGWKKVFQGTFLLKNS